MKIKTETRSLSLEKKGMPKTVSEIYRTHIPNWVQFGFELLTGHQGEMLWHRN